MQMIEKEGVFQMWEDYLISVLSIQCAKPLPL